MKTGGKRQSVQQSNDNSEDSDLYMSPERKRTKMDNNNSYKHFEEDGVSVLPSSDHEEEASDNEQDSNKASSKVWFDESSTDSVAKKSPKGGITPSDTVLITPPDQILSFKSRRSSGIGCKRDVFATLSDEIILMIFQWLPRQNLSDCALVCHRWRRITYDDSLWQRIDLTGSVLRSDYMGYVFQRNPIVLRMAQAEVLSPMFMEMSPAMEDFVCQVQYLDLSMALISSEDLAELLGKCTNLKKLSLEHCTTDAAVCSSISANCDLEVLNLSQCYELNAAGLEEILINCSEIIELNLAWTRLDSECIDIVCKLVNENIQKLNLSGGLKSMKDSHVQELVTRCTCLTELDLSDCTELTATCLDPIMKNLCDIEQLSFSRCYSISTTKYTKFGNCKSLQFLNIFGLVPQKQLDTLLGSGLKNIAVNKNEFSTIARPTVGIRRTSIWGLRVRD